LETANDFLHQGFPFVTIVADGRVYTADEFALTINDGDGDAPGAQGAKGDASM
jgi:hypothetical protein